MLSRPADLDPPVLVFGSYPPVPGPASAATIAAVRQAWAEGHEVRVVSPRPSAAHLSAPLVGVLAGYHLNRVRHSSGATDRLVFGMEQGVPLPVLNAVHSTGDWIRQRAAVAGLIMAFSRFRHVTLIVTGDLQVSPDVLAPLLRSVDEVLVASPEAAAFIDKCQIPPSRVRVLEAATIPPVLPGITPIGPPSVGRRGRPRQVVGVVARKILGRYYPGVRQRLNPLLVRALHGR
jgi:hypothetical protein